MTEQARRELLALRTIIDERLKQLELAEQEATKAKQPQNLDALPFEDSQYGGQWLNHEKVPSWVKDLEFPLETSEWKYYRTKTGNLKRYEKRETAKNG